MSDTAASLFISHLNLKNNHCAKHTLQDNCEKLLHTWVHTPAVHERTSSFPTGQHDVLSHTCFPSILKVLCVLCAKLQTTQTSVRGVWCFAWHFQVHFENQWLINDLQELHRHTVVLSTRCKAQHERARRRHGCQNRG